MTRGDPSAGETRSLLMKPRETVVLLCLAGSVFAAGANQLQGAESPPDLTNQLQQIDEFNAKGEWEPNWNSLSKHQIPEWFQDAKFGIYAHLGVYCVPAYGTEWYPRLMYQTNTSVYKHHVKTYGDPSKFGYKDFIPMFKLEKFDPAEWAQLYKDAGAKFAGPVAEHHDGFSMWASSVNRWNAAEMGPHRDVAGELIREIRRRGLKVITSFHHAFNIQGYYQAADDWDTADSAYRDLYGFPNLEDRTLPLERWLIKIKEVVDRYQPDQVWFDFGLGKIPDEYKQRMAAYYYNHEKTWGKPVIITRKDDYLPRGVGALDIERGRMKEVSPEPWQTDDSTAYNSWSWVKGLKVKPTDEIVHELIDIVSKNGVLLLNVCPRADGTISPDQQEMLRDLGHWLQVNGEAIYATRPWKICGEGPTRMEKGGAFLKTITYTPRDIRYTRSKDGQTLYAIAMGWPQQVLQLRFIKIKKAPRKAQVQLLGLDKPLDYEVNDGRLEIHMPVLPPEKRPCRYAYAFKLTGFDTDLSLAGRYMLHGALELQAGRAVLEGKSLKTEERGGRTDIGFWDNGAERVHWLLYIGRPGDYEVAGEFATVYPKCEAVLEVAGQHLPFEIHDTGGWDQPQLMPIGKIQIDKPGVYHFVLKRDEAKPWKAINVWNILLAPRS